VSKRRNLVNEINAHKSKQNSKGTRREKRNQGKARSSNDRLHIFPKHLRHSDKKFTWAPKDFPFALWAGCDKTIETQGDIRRIRIQKLRDSFAYTQSMYIYGTKKLGRRISMPYFPCYHLIYALSRSQKNRRIQKLSSKKIRKLYECILSFSRKKTLHVLHCKKNLVIFGISQSHG